MNYQTDYLHLNCFSFLTKSGRILERGAYKQTHPLKRAYLQGERLNQISTAHVLQYPCGFHNFGYELGTHSLQMASCFGLVPLPFQ